MEVSLTYLVISALSFPALAIYNSIAALFRSMGKTKAVMNISIVMNAINVIGNAIGIFVLRAGVVGVAVPSLVSRTFAAVVMLILCFQKKNTLYVQMKKVLSWNGKMLKRILNIAVPNGVENGLFQLSKVALSSIVALFGTVQIAANGVAQSFWSMAVLFCIAFGYAFVTVIGQCMGAGDIRYTMFASIFATVICRVIFSVIFSLWLNLGVVGICLAMVGDWLVKAVLILSRYRSRKWTKFRVID